MRIYVLISFILAFVTEVSLAQTSSVKGIVEDTVEHKILQNTVISLLRVNDSVLVKFARADKAGKFSIVNIKDGEYIVMVTHPLLGDYFDKITVAPGEFKDMGKISMTPKSKLLAEVIIKSGSPIRIKGDTTVYTADSFQVREGANVEELLRRLPGIQVDKDGKITAMGERVKKVLVDGEEFFGSDPGIATKNLRADAVKEVEVFDKKSDQAEFTGIDDGVKDKTINLKLKEDKKKGYFGKIEAGGGLPDKYDNAVMLNAFRGKRKIAGYGIMSNTGQTNLDWQDANNYGGGIDGLEGGVSDDGGIYFNWNGNDDENYSGGRNGIPTNWNAGLHYSNKYNNNKQTINGGYKFTKINAPGNIATFSETFLPDTSWHSASVSDNYSSNNKHALNFTFESNIDSMNSLKWVTRANKNDMLTRSTYLTTSFADNGDSINNSRRKSNNDGINDAVFTSVLWRHKFRKLSRTLSINTDLNWTRSENDGLLYSINNYFIGGIIDRRDTLDQENIRNNEGKNGSVRIAYTEPLSKTAYLEFSYSFSYNTTTNDRIVNKDDGSGKYEERVDSLSNFFRFDRMVNTPGLNFRVNKKKITYSLGSSVGFSHFTQENISENSTVDYRYVNFFPRASLTYKFKPSENLRFNYNGSTTAPTLEQLQPIPVNTDPLNIYIGNPDLDQAFRHNFNLNFSSWNALTERNVWTNMGFNLTQNAFTQFSAIDSSGRRIYQTVNTDGIYNFYLNLNYWFKIRGTKWSMGFGPNMNRNRNIDYVSDVQLTTMAKNTTITESYGVRLSINQYEKDKYNFYVGPNFTWNRSRASVNSSSDVNYWQIAGWAGGNVTLPGKFELGTDFNFEMRQKTEEFTENSNFTIWNATLTKRIIKNQLEFKIGIYDILNQNKGYQRNLSSYSFTESYYNTLKRFWLFKITWNISKNGKPPEF